MSPVHRPHLCFSSSSTASSSSPPSSSSPLKSCASCGQAQPLESLSCPSCSSMQPLPSDMDYYKALDLDLSRVGRGGWDIDTTELKRVWRSRMAVTHPDRMSGRSEKEQQIGAQQSALINRAYETLLSPLKRAQYLLKRHGTDEVGEADSLEDPELLMEVIELRERLEEAQSEQEAADVREENRGFMEAAIHTLSEAFAASPPDLAKARKAAVELRYWTNIDKAAREWSPGKRIEVQH
ncbi:molecular chaperone [Thecaphora frezii]